MVKYITDTHKDAQIEIVLYGQALEMVTQSNPGIAAGVLAFSNKENVQFKVCEVAMKRWKITREQLLPGVQTVPDGVYEIISKQGEGWGYIKVAN
jgi:intracellular sulfur oxidation DsrE/DsrF family protein